MQGVRPAWWVWHGSAAWRGSVPSDGVVRGRRPAGVRLAGKRGINPRPLVAAWGGCVAGMLGTALLALGGCDGKKDPDPPKPAPVKVPEPSKPEVRKDPAAVLRESREAMAKVLALSYAARVAGDGALAGKVATYEVEVVTARVQAEGGGWKMYLHGTMTPPEAGAPRSDVQIAYDGSTVRSLRPQENAVYEKDAVMEMADLAVFMAGQSAKPPVAWEMLEDAPFERSGGVLAYEGQRSIDEMTCDVVRIAPPAPPTPGKPGDAPPAPAPDEESDAGLRVYIAEVDHLPRRIERLVTAGGKPGAWVLDLGGLKVNTADERQFGMVSFVLEAPGDYTHRVVAAALKKDGTKTKPGQLLGDPERKLDLAMEPLAVGTPAPDWELKDPAGKAMKLSDHKGKVVVLDFWGTWCPYCLQAMPSIQKLHDRYKDKGVVVLGLDTENDAGADPAGFMRQKNYTYGLLLNAEKITKAYRVFGFPTLYVIGRDGKVALVEQGAKPDLFESVSKVIEQELGL